MKRFLLFPLAASFFLLFTLNANAYESKKGTEATETSLSSEQIKTLYYNFAEEDLTLRFQLDSTLHMIHGIAHNVTGKIEAYISATGKVTYAVAVRVPVSGLDTDNGKRDTKMRNESLDIAHFPLISFYSTRFLSFPEKPEQGKPFSFQLQGKLKIRDVEKTVTIPTLVEPKEGSNLLHITGKLPIKWADYHVVDPSVFIFHVDEKMEIYYAFDLPRSFLYR